jgi:hypothetical protein
MKSEKIMNAIGTLWVAGLMAMFVFAIGYTTWALATGNYHGTAAFEF